MSCIGTSLAKLPLAILLTCGLATAPALVQQAQAQTQKHDIIYRSNGTSINAKVEKVGTQEIEYHKADNPTGPIYSISRSDVTVIVYANGTSESITAPASSGGRETSTSPAPTPSRGADRGDKQVAFGVGSTALNFGLGAGNRFSIGNTSFLPELNASGERGIVALPYGTIGVGFLVSISYNEFNYYRITSTGNIVSTSPEYFQIGLGARGTYHLPVNKFIDPYAAVGLMYVASLDDLDEEAEKSVYGYNGPAITSVAGIRFLFKHFGFFSEIGYDTSYLKGGITIKFGGK
ncbi:hypothetical protein GCM10023185_28580 [Hymenobacter saemangeumensis]|uniref:Outer membrane protein beta-barrel domain-containing protein n=1 Tax=Hymenobacter saemangeumensis TaxID=1084522 RepID=A0ABP8IKG2_9BACT